MISWPLSSWTRKRVSGSASSTRPSNCISSSFAIQGSFWAGGFTAEAEEKGRSGGTASRAELRAHKPSGALRGLEVDRGGLAVALIGLELEGDLLALAQAADARALDGADMDEHVLAAAVRLDEAVALGLVEPLHRSRLHGTSF